MDESQIRALLTELDTQEQRPHLQAMRLEFRNYGGAGAWNCVVEDGTAYVVKAQNNMQDRQQDHQNGLLPLKVLTTELVCGRLGQLFEPIICPPVAIINIPEKLASVTTYPYNGNDYISAGPSFGSQTMSDMIEIRQGGRVELVPPEQIARLIVFQTWLQGDDAAALVSADGRRCLSIDHGYYLTGGSWDRSRLANLVVSPVRVSPFHQQIDTAFFQKVLEELRMLSERNIIKAFAAIPAEWGGTVEFRVELANFILQRRNLVEQAISTIWKGASSW